ncbi:MAG: hypothetical protein SangKO_034900 [Sandaracinaceae bacterium]
MTDGSRAAIVSVAARAVVTGRRAVAAPRPVVEILGRDAYPAAMADHASVVRPSRLGSQLLTLVPLGAAIALPYLAGLSHPFATLVGVFGFLAFRIFVVRFGLCRDHRRGVVLIRRGRFTEGLEAFERSERVWRARPRLDRLRGVLLGSATPHRFAVLALYNQAYALSRLGDGEGALERLSAVLEEDPSMLPARELRDVLLAGAGLHPEVGQAMTEGATE